MTQTSVASIHRHQRQTHLTARQRDALRDLVAEGLRSHRYRAAHAAETLDSFTSTDSPHDREVARATLESLLDGIREHEDALKRFHTGTYGGCSVCARPIPFERLEAIPEINHCVECARTG